MLFNLLKKRKATEPERIPLLQRYNIMIRASSLPVNDGYNILNGEEELFFDTFFSMLSDNNLKIYNVELLRMSDWSIEVFYKHSFLGRVNLYKSPVKYRVIKTGNKRATKVFTDEVEANNFVTGKENYYIEKQSYNYHSIQYMVGMYKSYDPPCGSVEDCMHYLPYWIKSIKYFQKL